MEKVIIKNPNHKAAIAEVKEISLNYLQAIVGGYIESVYIPQLENMPISCFCNEEGKLQGLDTNFPLVMCNGQVYDTVAGPVIFCGCDEMGESIGLTDEQIERVMNYLADPTTYTDTIFNVGFINMDEEDDEMQLSAIGATEADLYADLFNLINSVRDELNIKKLLYIEKA